MVRVSYILLMYFLYGPCFVYIGDVFFYGPCFVHIVDVFSLLSMYMHYYQGHNGRAAQQLIKLLKEGGPKVAVFGPTQSTSMILAAEITPVFDVVHVRNTAHFIHLGLKSYFCRLIFVL